MRPAPAIHAALVVAAGLTVVAAPGAVHAQLSGWRAGASLGIDSRYQRSDVADDRTQLATVGVRLRAQAGAYFVYYAAGLSYQLGVSFPGGFAYDVELLPVGVGTMVGNSARLAVLTGVGAGGVTSRLPAAARFPVEAMLEFDVVDRLRVAAWARSAWIAGAGARDRGSPNAPFGDELSAAFTLRWSRRYYPGRRDLSAGNGYYLGALYGERIGVRFFGLVFGYGIDASYRGSGF